MGYTHYWNGVTTPVPSKALKIIREILDEAYTIGLVQYEMDDNSPPVVTPQVIRFNGVGELGYETFFFQVHGNDFEFCKTERKPYDEIVMRVLIVLKHFLGDELRVKSDGKLDEEWRAARGYMKLHYGIESFTFN